MGDEDAEDTDLLEAFFYWVGAVCTIALWFSFDISFGCVDSGDMDQFYYAWLNVSQPVLSTIALCYEQVDKAAAVWLHGTDWEFSPNNPYTDEEMFIDVIVDNDSQHRRFYYTSSHDEELLRNFYLQKHDDRVLIRKTWLRTALTPLIPSLGIDSGLFSYRLMSWIPYTFFFFWVLRFCLRARFRFSLSRYIFFQRTAVGRQFIKFFDLHEGECRTWIFKYLARPLEYPGKYPIERIIKAPTREEAPLLFYPYARLRDYFRAKSSLRQGIIAKGLGRFAIGGKKSTTERLIQRELCSGVKARFSKLKLFRQRARERDKAS